MLLEFERFLFVNFPYVVCTTLAAFILWGEDLKRYFIRFILYSVLAALAQTISSEAIDLARILGNLIDNAMDAAKESQGNWVTIGIEEKDSMIVCSVTNPYTGDSEGLRKFLAPGCSSKPYHDGLGLYVCQKLCAKIKGRLDCNFENDHQVTFTVSIPQKSS